MKVLLINMVDDRPIMGVDIAFKNDLVEYVEGKTAHSIQNDARQFIETWTPDVLVIAEIIKPNTASKAPEIVSMLRREKLLRQPAIYMGNAADTYGVQILQSGVQAIIPLYLDSKSQGFGINADLLKAQAVNLTNLAKGQATNDFKLGAITLLQDTREIFIFDDKLNLTHQEANVLTPLVLAKGRTVSKDAMFSQLYTYEAEIGPKILDVYICKIRKKLSDRLQPLGYEGEKIIATVWGQGYKIDLQYMPGLDDKLRSSFVLGYEDQRPDDSLALPSPSTKAPAAAATELTVRAPTSRPPASERTLPPKKGPQASSDELARIKHFLQIVDFRENPANPKIYAELSKRAIDQGHSAEELFEVFGACFKPLWKSSALLSFKTFEYHLSNPERLAYYKIDQDTLSMVTLPETRLEALQPSSTPSNRLSRLTKT